MVPTMCHMCGRRAFKTCKLCHRGYCAEHSGPAGICQECYNKRGGAEFRG